MPRPRVTARPRFMPVRSPLRIWSVAHCIVNELLTRMMVMSTERPRPKRPLPCQLMKSVPSGGHTAAVARTLK